MEKKKLSRRIICALLVSALTFSLAACGDTKQPSGSGSASSAPSPAPGQAVSLKDLTAPGDPDPANIPQALQIDWNHRYTYAELEQQIHSMAEEASDIAELYSIGTSWQEREMWCLELTNKSIPAEQKTGIAVYGPIHGGEREGASCAMYAAWWMTLNRDSDYMKAMMDNYIIYVIPCINPDGYEQSFVINNRPNLRPIDHNENGIPFSDPYTDIDGDGYIATLYRGVADVQPDPATVKRFGMESPDWDKNGVPGDDPRTSGIDMNRTFNYQWNRFDIETKDTQVIGNNSMATAGPDAASEPEVQAVQNFMAEKAIAASAVMHTGIQCVLYPWCYRPYDADNPADAEIPFMKETAAKMAGAIQEATGRGFYTKSSYEDYPTSAELIDYAFGTFNTHAYTIEVYDGGKSESGDINDCKWENTMPEPKWVFYSQDELKNMGLDPAALVGEDGSPLAADEGLWFYTSPTNQMVDKTPEEQDVMVKGVLEGVLVMIESEPYGEGYSRPFFVK